jgi:hypothetical protein
MFGRGLGCGGLWDYPGLVNAPGDDFFQAIAQLTQSDSSHFISGVPIINEALNALSALFIDVVGVLPAAAMNTAKVLIGGLACGGTETGTIMTSRALLGLGSKYISSVFDHDDKSLEYAQSFNCPYLLPTAEQATAQYLTNSIDLDRLICLVKANGYKWEPWSHTVDSNRTRLNAAETLALWRRGKITNDQTNDYLRQLGYLYEGERQGLGALTEQIPPVSDIMSMMLRDVADEVNVDWTQSDKIFVDKWAGQLKDWGYMQGIPELYAKYLWRAHWRLPSPTQIGEFWVRLRKDPKFGGEEKLRTKLRNVLLQDDYHPDWVDSYMAVIEKPLTRIDAGRAFQVGVLSGTDLELAYNQLGYSDKNAQTLVKFKTKQLIEQYKKSSYVTSYAKGEISSTELDQQLRDTGLPSEVVQPVMEYAKFKLKLIRRKACTASYKKRFLLGEFTQSQLSSLLATSGLDPEQVGELSAAYQCEKDQRGKTISASTLCSWYNDGVIDEVEMYQRLKNLGYTEDDATKITRDCMIRNGIKLNKQKQTDLQKVLRQQRQADAAAAKLARQLAKSQQQTSSNQSAASKARDLRAKKIITIGEHWAHKTGQTLADSIVGVRKVIDYAIANGIAPINTVYEAADAAAKDPKVMTIDDLANEVANLLVDVG